MGENKHNATLPPLEADEQKERAAFAYLVAHLVRGELHEILKDAPLGVCEEFGRIWDAQSHVPVGILFKRPKFEEDETLNKYQAIYKAAKKNTIN